jgi:hypothetical protein
MADVYCYAYVEDAPSAAVVQKLVKTRNGKPERAAKNSPSLERALRAFMNV